jgi:hypothetical protein
MYVDHPVIKHGLLENISFSSMIFPAVKRHIFIGDFPATVDDTGGFLRLPSPEVHQNLRIHQPKIN